ncbi:MAG: hypothetical protein ACO1Q7_21130 [Gemmatimonas sp.]
MRTSPAPSTDALAGVRVALRASTINTLLAPMMRHCPSGLTMSAVP